jgi:hypothetical protein
VALAVPATAASGNLKQSGFIVGDKAATVKLRVKVRKGDAVKVGGFKAQNVLAKCKDKDIRIALIALEPVPVQRDGDFKVRLSDGDGGILRISGTVLNDGKATKGTVKTNDFEQGKDTCRVAKQRFRTSLR